MLSLFRSKPAISPDLSQFFLEMGSRHDEYFVEETRRQLYENFSDKYDKLVTQNRQVTFVQDWRMEDGTLDAVGSVNLPAGYYACFDNKACQRMIFHVSKYGVSLISERIARPVLHGLDWQAKFKRSKELVRGVLKSTSAWSAFEAGEFLAWSKNNSN